MTAEPRRWHCPLSNCGHPWGWRRVPFEITCRGCGVSFSFGGTDALTITLDEVELALPS